MEIRFAQKKDKQALMHLWGYCFKDGDAYIKWCFDNRYREEDTLLYDAADHVGGMVQLLPYRFVIDGDSILCSFIEGLAVAPDMRSAKIADSLMCEAFEQMKNRGHAYSFLIPFETGFYRRLGYGVCSYIQEIRIPIERLSAYRTAGDFSLARQDSQSIQDLSQVYLSYCTDKNCYQDRSASYWNNILEDAALSGANLYLLQQDNACTGYVYYILQDNTFFVLEMCYLNDQAFSSIMGFIRSHHSQVDSAVLRIAQDDPFYREFSRIKDAVSVIPYAMVRVIDVQAVLLQKSKHFYGEAKIQIHDPQCPWNEGIFLVKENMVSPAELLPDQQPDAELDITAFSELAAGAISFEEAVFMGKLRGNPFSVQGLFAKQKNFMNLMFE